MKALIKYSDKVGDIRFTDVPEPVCKSDEVKIKIRACGICATDLHILSGEYPWEAGTILGHEFSGEIAEVGKNVTKFKVGDRVASCMDGGFAEFTTKRENDWVFRIPDFVSFEEAALLEPLCASANAVIRQSDIEPGDVVLIEGPGTMGLFALEFVKLCGGIAIVSSTKNSAGRLELAKRLGADYVVNVEESDIRALVSRITRGKGVDLVLECSGAQAALDTAVDVLKTGGQITQVGIFSRKPSLDLTHMVYHSQKLVGSIAYTKEVWERCLELLEAGAVSTKEFVKEVLPLGEWERGFDITRKKKALRVILVP